MKELPTICPACGQVLRVQKLYCDNCATGIDGTYDLPPLARLSLQEQEFILEFVKVSGSLKEMSQLLSLSYPTVRNRLDDIIEKLKKDNKK
jgi:hypothetical protein